MAFKSVAESKLIQYNKWTSNRNDDMRKFCGFAFVSPRGYLKKIIGLQVVMEGAVKVFLNVTVRWSNSSSRYYEGKGYVDVMVASSVGMRLGGSIVDKRGSTVMSREGSACVSGRRTCKGIVAGSLVLPKSFGMTSLTVSHS